MKIDYQLSAKAKLSGYWGTNATRAQFSQQLNGSEGLPDVLTATRASFTRSYTWRANFDYSLTPTMLLHVGAGFVQYIFNDNSPTLNFDQVKTLGLVGATVPNSRFPVITGLCQTGTTPLCTGVGGMANMGPVFGQADQQQITPTFQATTTWVKGNHTYKFGADFRPFGFLGTFNAATYGVYNFSAATTGQPYTNNVAPGGINIGFGYASFLLGQVDNGVINYPATVRTGKQQWGFYAQDSWKITRRMTLDYGLRYDYSTYPREQYGRMPTLSPTMPNPTVGGYLGATIFEANCNCQFAKNYKNGWGPRLGLAYQINDKTVLRAGFGIAYDGTGTGGAGNAASNNPYSAPGFGLPAMQLQAGIPDAFKTPWPNLTPGLFPSVKNLNGLAGPPVVVDPNSGRPPRQTQWSIGLQREIVRNLVVEASYVGNRGAWWPSSTLVNYNAIPDSTFKARGVDLSSATDRGNLLAQIGSAGAGRFQNQLPYAIFPRTGTVAQSMRPYPQFSSGLTPLWAPIGRTWYDSLQAKVTKRLSRGLDLSYAFTFQKELNSGIDAGAVNDVFNRGNNKCLSSFSRPLVHVIAANYKVPRTSLGNRYTQYALRDWTLGTVLQYASVFPIPVPVSQNNLNGYRYQATTVNRVAGVDPFLKDLNCHCIDPNKELVFNPAAWTEAPAGTYGTAARFYNDFRYQRHPQESINFGRVFAIRERMSFTVRMEFTNLFNRTQMANPAGTNIAAAKLSSPAPSSVCATGGCITSGFGFISPSGAGLPRQGTMVARFTF